MNSEQNDFEQLRRLLALKRHEQPPPGFYNSFSYQVIARIKAGETGQELTFVDRLFDEAPWIQRLWAAFETKPLLAGAVSFAVCGLVATGLFYGEAPSGVNVGAVSGMYHSDMASTGTINPRRPLMVDENGPGALPPYLRENPLVSYPARLPIQNINWMRTGQ